MQLVLQGVFDFLFELMGDVVAVRNVTDAGEGSGCPVRIGVGWGVGTGVGGINEGVLWW